MMRVPYIPRRTRHQRDLATLSAQIIQELGVLFALSLVMSAIAVMAIAAAH